MAARCSISKGKMLGTGVLQKGNSLAPWNRERRGDSSSWYAEVWHHPEYSPAVLPEAT